MNAREERGLALAATAKLIQKGKVWLVPSQTGNGKKYTVCPDDDCPFCSCPDFEDTGLPCKHVFAARFTSKREEAKDGTVTETHTLTLTEKKVYRHPNWPLYSLAQREEKRRFLVLLNDLCKRLPNPPQSGAGRRRTPMASMVFASCLKVFTGFSSRRYGTDLDDAADAGLVAKMNPCMVCTFLESDLMTPVLKHLMTASALPLAAVETTFAPDSTGFSTSRFIKWMDEKYGSSGKRVHCFSGGRKLWPVVQ